MRIHSERGSALLISVMVLAALGVLGTAIVFNSVSDRAASRFDHDAADALAAAETGIAVALRAIQDLNAPLEDADGDGRPDFTLSDSLAWGGEYTVVAEVGEIRGVDISAYRAQGFTVVAEGRVRGATRRVKVEIIKDTFLKFARFVATTGTGYGCRDDVEAELYVGGNLNIATCASGQEPHFLEHVWVTGQVNNNAGGVFDRGYTQYAPEIDIVNSVDFDEIAQIARGTASNSTCEYGGGVGYYQDVGAGWDPIGLGGDVLELHEFNFYDLVSVPGDTIISYDGVPTINTQTGNPMRYGEFNGVIYFEGDGHVKGVAAGTSGRSMTIYASDDVYADSSIVTGTTGFNPVTGLPNGAGDPVNIGLVGQYYAYLGDVPRIVQIDAAIMAVRRNWRARNTSAASHPPLLAGPVDLDLDGIFGESPHNNDPDPGTGWDEMFLTPDHWVLNINGPLITYNGASAVPWSSGSIVGAAQGITWQYNYDLDIREFPPPCFPNPINLWKQVSWTEIFTAEDALESHLPS